eukprot:SM000053S17406  [mRNA]  locus=s53:193572:195507:+ [translate_table: standard]
MQASQSLLRSVLKPKALASQQGGESGRSLRAGEAVGRSRFAAAAGAEGTVQRPSPASAKVGGASAKAAASRACLCAPTQHAGSFRCRLHRSGQPWGRRTAPKPPTGAPRAPATDKAIPGSLTPMAVFTDDDYVRREYVDNAYGDTKEAQKAEGPMRFLRFAAGAGAAAAAIGAAATALKNRGGKSGQDMLNSLGPDAPPGAAAAGAGEGGSHEYSVRSGDTLNSIGQMLGTPAQVIAEANGLRDDTIVPGQVLWIPKTYTIRQGDTLSKIAREHGVSVDAILRINSIRNPDIIYPDDILLLP